MLNEFRILCCYGNCLNGRGLLSLWRIRMLQTSIVKMSKCDVFALSLVICHMELPTHREADREGNESLCSPFLNFLSVLWQPPPRDRVGQPVGGWLPSKSEKPWYASLLRSKFLRLTSTSNMTKSACASLRGLCASVSIHMHMDCRSLRHQEATDISCPFLSLFMRLSKTFSLCFCPYQSVAFEVLWSG